MTILPLQEGHAEQLCGWRYEPPYSIYNWPSWDKMKKDGIEFGDPALRAQQYSGVVDVHGRLIGYAQFFPMSGVTRLGLGLHPELCGQGLGSRLARLAALEALRREPLDEIDLEVWTWNQRAIRSYEKAGFRITDQYERIAGDEAMDCYCMVFDSRER
ncbi:GNAT family N-acetyltransferase [Paenibacillus sp. HB172176]|uniref:GNAT family N-acetyltransferase n=1 Tax=Paenibacillus sp. HB172176 TaxID=2493690 RepID=UPI001F0EF23D|nr:GNAT family N-acetyltransferase [Paenibacillus sp. HB172176]